MRPGGAPLPPRLTVVLMLMTAGLTSSATLANVPLGSGIWTGRMGASTAAGALADTRQRSARLPA